MDGLIRRLKVIGDDNAASLDLRVAFATDDGINVNQHFGSAKSFVIYAVNPQAFTLVDLAEFEPIGNDEVSDKLTAKLSFLDGCIAVYCCACGASAVKKLIERQIQPLKVVGELSIKELLAVFQQELNEGPSSWLAKAIQYQRSGHLASFENPLTET